MPCSVIYIHYVVCWNKTKGTIIKLTVLANRATSITYANETGFGLNDLQHERGSTRLLGTEFYFDHVERLHTNDSIEWYVNSLVTYFYHFSVGSILCIIMG